MAIFGSTDVAVKFIADASSVKNEADKVDGIGKGLKSAALGIGGALAGAFAVDKITDFVGAAEEAKVASQRLTKTLQLAGDATGEWAAHQEDLATNLMNATGIDDEVIKGGQAILATFHNVGRTAGETGGAFDRATTAALDMSKAGFGSVESASTMLGKALEDPVKGITALGKAGVNFSEEQKKAIKAMVDSGDQAGAMNAVLQGVEGQVGGVAAATVTASDKMSVAWGETQEAVGSALLPLFEKLTPVIQKLAEWIQNSLVPAFADFVGWASNKLGPVFSDIWEWVQNKLIPALGRLADWFSDNKEEIAAYFTPFIDAVKTVAPVIGDVAKKFGELAVVVGQKLIPPLQAMGSWISDNKEIFPALAIAIAAVGAAILISLIPAFIGWALAAGAAALATLAAMAPLILLIAAITLIAFVIIKNWDTIKEATLTAWGAISDFFIATWETIKGAFQSAWDFISGIWDAIRGAAETVINWIRDNWQLLLGILTGPFGIAVAIITSNWETIKGAVKTAIDWIGNIVSGVTNLIVAPFQAAADLLSGVWDGIKSGFQGAIDVVKNAWNGFARFWNGVEVDVPGVTMPGPIPNIPGFTFGLPDLPMFAKGGIAMSPMLAGLAEKGPEAVIPLDRLKDFGWHRTGPSVVIETAHFNEQADIDLFMRRVAWAAQTERV